MNKKFLLSLSLLATHAIASPLYHATAWMHQAFAHPVVAINGGLFNTGNAGFNKTFPMINESFYVYHGDFDNHTQGILGLFVGSDYQLQSNWHMQLGLAYNQSLSFHTTGTIFQGADVQSADNYEYSYNTVSRQFMLVGKFQKDAKLGWHPYGLVGVGASFNSTKSWNTTVPPFLTFTPEFKSKTNSAFTYQLGLGVDIDVYPQLRAGLGYRFADLGRNDLGNGTIDVVSINDNLKQKHVYTNNLIAELTYLF